MWDDRSFSTTSFNPVSWLFSIGASTKRRVRHLISLINLKVTFMSKVW
jgi:hypothetical protein